MNYERLARLIDGVETEGDKRLFSEVIRLAGDNHKLREAALSEEKAALYEENQRLRNAIEIIEHTLATLRGEK